MVHKRVRRLVFTKKVTRVHVRKNGKNVSRLKPYRLKIDII